MAQKHEESPQLPSIKDIEAELNAVKNSLKALQQPKAEAPRSATATKQASAKKPKRDYGATAVATYTASLLDQAANERQERMAYLKQLFKKAEQQRKAELLRMKQEALTDKAGRLNWVKDLRASNHAFLNGFAIAFDRQCEHDRQMRLRTLDRIKQDLQLLLHG